jgi:hypothetical protein
MSSQVPILNRGVANQPDIAIYGLNYLPKVKDNDTNIQGNRVKKCVTSRQNDESVVVL